MSVAPQQHAVGTYGDAGSNHPQPLAQPAGQAARFQQAVIVDATEGGFAGAAGTGGKPAPQLASKSAGKGGLACKVCVAFLAVAVLAGAAIGVLKAVESSDDSDRGLVTTSSVTFRVRRAFVGGGGSAGSGSGRRLVGDILYGGAVGLSDGTGGHVDSLAMLVREIYLCKEVACDGTTSGPSPISGSQDMCEIGVVGVGHLLQSHCITIFEHAHLDSVGDNGVAETQKCTDVESAHASGWMVDFAKGEAETKLSGQVNITTANAGTYKWAMFRPHAYWRLNATVVFGDDERNSIRTKKCGADVCGSECFRTNLRDCTSVPFVETRIRGGDRYRRCSHNMTTGASEPVYLRAKMAGGMSDLIYRFAAPVEASPTNGNLTIDFAYSLDGVVYGDVAGIVNKNSNGVENHHGVTDGAFAIQNHPLGIVPIARTRNERLLKYSYAVEVAPHKCQVVPGHPCQRGSKDNACSVPRFGGGPNDNCDPTVPGTGEHCRPLDVGVNVTSMTTLASFDVVVDVYYVVPSGATRATDLTKIAGVTMTPRRSASDPGEFKLPFRAIAAEDVRVANGAAGVPQVTIGGYNRWGLVPTITNMTLMQVPGGVPVSRATQVMLQNVPIVHRRCGPTDAPDWDRFMRATDPDYPVDASGNPGGDVQTVGGGATNWPFSNCQATEVYFTCPHTLRSIVALGNDNGGGESAEEPEEVAQASVCSTLRGQDPSVLTLPHIHDIASARSDQFLMDFPILNGHPHPGLGNPPTDRAANNPHDGFHIYPGNLQNQSSGYHPENYPPIYAPFDGYIKAGGVTYYESSRGWTGYNIDYVFAQDDTGREVSLDIGVEPQINGTWSYYRSFVRVNTSKVVCKGDILGYFYLPPLACDAVQGYDGCPPAHIHANLKGAPKAAAIWTQEVVDEFASYWNDRHARDKPPGPVDWTLYPEYPPCMGYRVSESENPFGTGYQLCL